MPLYEFACQHCHKEFELLVPLGENSAICPYCCSRDTRRQISLTQYRHADHWQKDMLQALARSQERDQMKAETKRT
jgi:putative FmdB family regulatory protein